MTTQVLPGAFIWRRVHSLFGLWLVLFLIEHLLVNSQAGLLLGESGRGFVTSVNAIHNLPYLQAIEITLLGVPFFVHLVWGVKYLLTGKFNSYRTDGSKPYLSYGRNRAYSWQRITSWLLIFMLIGHVVKFRFIDYPDHTEINGKEHYYATVNNDDGLASVAERLDAKLCQAEGAFEGVSLKENQIIAAADNFGTISLLVVRNTFQNPIYVFLYTLFVLAACFHAFNGFWTFLITWGILLKYSSQKGGVKFAIGLMILIAFLGLASIWGTYWSNLRH